MSGGLDILFIVLRVIHILACVLLVAIILLQPGKGGMSAGFGGGAQQVFGGRGAGNILTKATGIFATIFMLTSVALAYQGNLENREFKGKQEEEERREKLRDKMKAEKSAAESKGTDTKSTETKAPETKPAESAAAPK